MYTTSKLLGNAVVVAVCVLLAAAVVITASILYGAESHSEVTVGVGNKISTQTRTQGGDTVHDEVVVAQYDHSYGTPTAGSRSLTNATSTAAFSSQTKCHSLIAVAASTNPDVVYFGYGTLTLLNLGLPLYPGTRQQLRAPNEAAGVRDCALLSVAGGAGCTGGSPCVVFFQTQ